MAAPARRASSQEENDEAIARSMARAEQEGEDEWLARQLAGDVHRAAAGPRGGGGGGGAPAAGPVVQMVCQVCGTASQVMVPPGSMPGVQVQAQCPACTSVNNFTMPGGRAGQRGGGGMRHGGVGQRGLLGGAGLQPPPPPSLGRQELRPTDLVPAAAPEDVDSPYVACLIGDVAVEMLVDTGAQTSVISMPLVQRFNLASRLDSRYQGVAAGVGRARILGKLRGIPVMLGHVEFSLDFSVLGVEDQLLILGIDQMRRFRCVVDMERQVLLFGGRDGVEVPFLPQPQNRLMYRNMGCPQS